MKNQVFLNDGRIRSRIGRLLDAAELKLGVSGGIDFPIEQSKSERAQSRHRNLLFAALSLAMLLFMSGPIRRLVAFSLDTDHSHTSQILLVPFVTAFLILLNRKSIFRRVGWSVMPGAVVMALGVALFLAGNGASARLGENDFLAYMTASLVVGWLGGFLLFYGVDSFKAAMFPLFFLLCAVPIPELLLDRTILFLQTGSTEIVHVLFKLTATPVLREGFVFTLPGLAIEVAPECSGIRSGIALFILCLISGHLFLRTTWKKGILLLAAIPILLFKNAIRIAVLSLLAVHYDQRIMTGSLHKEGGIPFFFLGLCLLYPVLAILMKSEKQTRLSSDSKP